MKKSMPASEWFFVATLLLLMASLLGVAKVNAYRTSHVLKLDDKSQEVVVVSVEGAVAKPGAYSVLVGTPLGEVLRKAKPKPWANLDVLALKDLIIATRKITVDELSQIKVFVEGAVENPQEIFLPAKSRVCDLKGKVNLTKDADLTYFRRRKLLKNGEKIEVPKKKLEGNSAF